MDTDDARRASEEIYLRIRQQASLGRLGSAGDVTLLSEPTEAIIWGRSTHRKETGEQIQTVTPSSEDQSTQDVDTTAGAVGGETLLHIALCSMAEEPGEQSQSLFRSPMSDPESNLEWDEAEYMKLRFIAARHYASRGHWDDAYAYVLRT